MHVYRIESCDLKQSKPFSSLCYLGFYDAETQTCVLALVH